MKRPVVFEEIKYRFVSGAGDEEYAYVDGSEFASAYLDGVLFRISIVAGRKFVAEPATDAASGTETLSLRKWCRKASEHAGKREFFRTFDGLPVWVEDQHGNRSPHIARQDLKERICYAHRTHRL